MKHLLLLGCVLAVGVTLGDGLRCFHCAISVNRCTSGSRNCTEPNEVCFERVGKAGSATAYMSGCTDLSNCNQTFEQNFLSFTVSLKTRCCNTDLCNGGTYIKSSLTLSSILAGFWIVRFL